MLSRGFRLSRRGLRSSSASLSPSSVCPARLPFSRVFPRSDFLRRPHSALVAAHHRQFGTTSSSTSSSSSGSRTGFWSWLMSKRPRLMSQETEDLIVPGVLPGKEDTLVSTRIEGKAAKPEDIDLVIYHGGCPDGWAGAWAAWKLLGDQAEYIGIKHSAEKEEEVPDVTGKHVAIVDFSFRTEFMKEMISKAASLIVLDHHRTAEQDIVGQLDPKYYVFEMRQSGATLAWNFFHPDKPVPMFLRYIEDRDIWRWSMAHAREYLVASDLVKWEFEEYDEIMFQSGDEGARKLIQDGIVCLKYQKMLVKSIAKSAEKRRFKVAPALRCMVVNAYLLKSDVGAELYELEDVDVGVIWTYKHETQNMTFSLRSRPGVDCSVIARHYGGGGHAQAAGMSVPGSNIEDLFLPVEEEEADTDPAAGETKESETKKDE